MRAAMTQLQRTEWEPGKAAALFFPGKKICKLWVKPVGAAELKYWGKEQMASFVFWPQLCQRPAMTLASQLFELLQFCFFGQI